MDAVALLFPGQGSQYVGMGKNLYDEFNIARDIFKEANNVLGFNLQKLCFEGSVSELNKIENMLLAILTVSVAAFNVYMKEIGIKPQFTAGHSLGEYSALTCCEAINFSDTLEIVRLRTMLAQEITETENSLVTVVSGVDVGVVEEVCCNVSSERQIASVACFNAPDQAVISGHQDAVIKAEDRLIEMDAQITPLLMSPPFHSPLMWTAASRFKQQLEKYIFNQPKWPVISNVYAKPYLEKEDILNCLTLQMTSPVRWQATMDYLEKHGIQTAIEIGPQAILTNLVKMNRKKFQAVSFGQKDDREKLIEVFPSMNNLKQFEQSKNSNNDFDTVITRCLAIAVATRNNNWNNEEYENGVIEPYERIVKIQQQIEKDSLLPTKEQMYQALMMLKSVFITKKVPIDVQFKRFNQIFSETGTQDIFKEFLMELEHQQNVQRD